MERRLIRLLNLPFLTIHIPTHRMLVSEATGSVAAYFNRVSSSLTNTLTNYTILHITDMGSNTRKFTIRANNVGSEFNSDIAETGHLVTAISAMSGGHLAYNQFDDNFILFSHSGSKNHLFTLDHDGVTDSMPNRQHDFTVKVNGSSKFALDGELVTGSTYVGAIFRKQQADIVLVRGSIYHFRQNHSSNGSPSSHPLVFHTSPLTGSAIGTEVIALGKVPDVTYFNNGSVAYGSVMFPVTMLVTTFGLVALLTPLTGCSTAAAFMLIWEVPFTL